MRDGVPHLTFEVFRWRILHRVSRSQIRGWWGFCIFLWCDRSCRGGWGAGGGGKRYCGDRVERVGGVLLWYIF